MDAVEGELTQKMNVVITVYNFQVSEMSVEQIRGH